MSIHKTLCIVCLEKEIPSNQEYCDDCRRRHDLIDAYEANPVLKGDAKRTRDDLINQQRRDDYQRIDGRSFDYSEVDPHDPGQRGKKPKKYDPRLHDPKPGEQDDPQEVIDQQPAPELPIFEPGSLDALLEITRDKIDTVLVPLIKADILTVREALALGGKPIAEYREAYRGDRKHGERDILRVFNIQTKRAGLPGAKTVKALQDIRHNARTKIERAKRDGLID